MCLKILEPLAATHKKKNYCTHIMNNSSTELKAQLNQCQAIWSEFLQPFLLLSSENQEHIIKQEIHSVVTVDAHFR